MGKALLLIDVQEAFTDSKWGRRNNPDAEKKIQEILADCRQARWTIIHIQHVSDSPDSVFYKHGSGFSIKAVVAPQPNEKRILKSVNSAFIGTDLEQYLNEKQIKTVAIVGLTTPHCVSTTARMSGNLGYQTYLISDATAAFEMRDHLGNWLDPETIHHLSLATIHEEFATVLDIESFKKDVVSIEG